MTGLQSACPLFTVATITYNSGRWVKQTIESVLASSFADFEFLISDDCSTDDTWDIIQQYSDPRIRLWRNEINLGEYPNRNKVLNEAKGKYIIYIDGDDILYKSTLRNLSEYIAVFPQAGMIWGIPHYDFIVFPALLMPSQIFRIEFLGNYYWSMIGFPETLFKKEILLNAGGFNEEYALGDYFIKKKLALNADVLLIPIGSAYWRTSAGQASKSASKNYRSLIEQFEIDNNFLLNKDIPLTQQECQMARERLSRRTAIQVFSSTIAKGKFGDFFFLRKRLQMGFPDFLKMLKTPISATSLERSGENPILSDYNFINPSSLP